MRPVHIFRSACLGAAAAFGAAALIGSGQGLLLFAASAAVLLIPGRLGRRLRTAAAALCRGLFTLLAALAAATLGIPAMQQAPLGDLITAGLVLLFCLLFARRFSGDTAKQAATSISKGGHRGWLGGVAAISAGVWAGSIRDNHRLDDKGFTRASHAADLTNNGWLSNASGLNPSLFESGLNENAINPATGLPMVSGIGGIDVGGSPFGTDIHDASPDLDGIWSHTSTANWMSGGMDDHCSSGLDDLSSSSFDDSWSSNSWG